MCRFLWYSEQTRPKSKGDPSEDRTGKVHESSGFLGLRRKDKSLAGVRNLGAQGQKYAAPSAVVSKSDQKAQATEVQAERARFKNLVVLWARNAEVRAWRGIKNSGFQGRKCADSRGILSKGGRAT